MTDVTEQGKLAYTHMRPPLYGSSTWKLEPPVASGSALLPLLVPVDVSSAYWRLIAMLPSFSGLPTFFPLKRKHTAGCLALSLYLVVKTS